MQRNRSRMDREYYFATNYELPFCAAQPHRARIMALLFALKPLFCAAQPHNRLGIAAPYSGEDAVLCSAIAYRRDRMQYYGIAVFPDILEMTYSVLQK